MLSFLLALFVVQAPAVSEIRAYLKVTPEFCTGGQPRPEHFALLKADGVKAVLNLRQPGEHRSEEEQEAVKAAGLRYFNIPVNYQQPTDAAVDEFLKITDDPANRPMFIHCTAAIRVGAFWMIRRVLRDGMTTDAALEEARKVGMRDAPHLEQFARTYIAAHRRNSPAAALLELRTLFDVQCPNVPSLTPHLPQSLRRDSRGDRVARLVRRA